ncbi:LAMI_0H04148g1_1 [Lachancea mirantina]|uniref:LAMI_0H04148g1_1 n=1 Tax=Lachancea mirantina TaxID=1230905 RepID=A0A1G4KEI3_9SACH|nr:LAMI_0H04148g1_1 [Lachancea mirantina]
MSGYFDGFTINKLSDTLSNAAHKTQDKLNSAIANMQLDDPQARLSLKTRTRYLQETLGAVDDISQLPPQYQLLEKKCDAIEKVCRRILVVTRTFEVEGYDYPPNLSESISDWWSTNREGIFGFIGNKSKGSKDLQNEKEAEAFLPRSFAQALSKAAKDCGQIVSDLEKESRQHSGNDPEEEDEDLISLGKMLDSWAECERSIDEGKEQMDTLMAKEFNSKIKQMLDEDFKKVHALRKKVEESRLKFDTLRYELKVRESQTATTKKEPEAENAEKSLADSSPNKETNSSANAPEVAKDETPQPETSKSETSEPKASKAEVEVPPAEENEEHNLLETLEDEFVSSTTEAVEAMTSVTDSVEVVSLVRLFHNLQLVYHRQCVQDLEASMKTLDELEGAEA